MINIKFHRLLSPSQRQSFVMSITAFFSAILLLALGSMLSLICYRGLAYFWPSPIYTVSYYDAKLEQASVVYGQIFNEYEEHGEYIRWFLYSSVNHPTGNQMLLEQSNTLSVVESANSANITLKDGRTVMGVPAKLNNDGRLDYSPQRYLDMANRVAEIQTDIDNIQVQHLSQIHQQLAQLDTQDVADDAPARHKLNNGFSLWQQKIESLERQRNSYVLDVAMADGQTVAIPLADIESVFVPGQLNLLGRWQVFLRNIGQFLVQAPKQANTAGGVFPALFGTVLMVLVMTLIVAPFGVMAAVYLSEYAPDNFLTSAIRISVSNMASVPSIVYGVFGLGFFVYTLGGNIDSLLFSDTLPAPTMGTPGLFWAALTMAMLTLPVVIVATEEGLRRVPQGLRASSYALGATKAETVLRIVLPMASPGIMTGIILAIARAAGEVAPLMLVGAVKFAPNLPVDGDFPYFHLDRQFMHLGVLIYDGAFHSQTDAKGASMMFATCLLLLLVVVTLNILAVILRARLRNRYLVN
ncbi:phosphate ABC transporter permease PstA [Alteromonas sp. C1M14]|uniref:phosphate ABC transporter permease PstA n=1 Tax=Alteromonas sp. C1M14 TaxID=2841567 RepID=UPI001C09E294|nr:phosphate ABC transporter permease PstA [Alteromonas sp. C1M14]MBU2977735.1 phosphate ABC transporter permease PstA [Alteromonas sp. C1M14]